MVASALTDAVRLCRENDIEIVRHDGLTVNVVEALEATIPRAQGMKVLGDIDFPGAHDMAMLYSEVSRRFHLATHFAEVAVQGWHAKASFEQIAQAVSSNMHINGLGCVAMQAGVITNAARVALLKNFEPDESYWSNCTLLAYPQILGNGKVTKREHRSEGEDFGELSDMLTNDAHPAKARMARRLRHSKDKTPSTPRRDQLIESTLAKIASFEGGFSEDENVAFYRELRALDFRFMTFMQEGPFQQLMKDHRSKSFWDLHAEGKPSWHRRFSDAPEIARGFMDEQIFGEPSVDTTFGVYADMNDTLELKNLAAMYGPRVVVWDDRVLDICTLTLGDSQCGSALMPASMKERFKAVFALRTYKACDGKEPSPEFRQRIRVGAAISSGQYGVAHINFIEVQAHALLPTRFIKTVFSV
jgi:hypothetical protein